MQNANLLDRHNEVFYGLTIAGGFQELSSGNRSVRILRHDIAGITIYANTDLGNERELWRNRYAYMLAYESELPHQDEIQQVIIESNQSVAVYQLLELLHAHAERIQREIEAAADAQAIFDYHAGIRTLIGPIDFDRFSGFADPTMRQPIQQTLERLSEKPLDEAYEGFTNAVISEVDDWLMTRWLMASGSERKIS
jgi:hypothetical protein